MYIGALFGSGKVRLGEIRLG